MNHQEIKGKLEAFYDQELMLEDAGEVSIHLQSCETCREEIASWKKIQAAFLKSQEIAPSEAFVWQVMEKIESKQAFNFFSFLRWVFPTLALMSAALFFVSIWLADDSIAFETAILEGGSPLTIQEVAVDVERDWTGLEAL